MNRWLRVSVGLVLCSQVAGAEDLPAFATGVSSVAVDTAVTIDQRPVTGLKVDDFILRDEGQARPILHMVRDELPLDIVLVCQTPSTFEPTLPLPSGAGNPKSIADAARLTDSGINSIMNAAASVLLPRRPEDRIAIVRYGIDPHIELSFTNDTNAVAAAIRRVGSLRERSAATSLRVALEYAVRMVGDVNRDDPNARTNRRRVIVLISNLLGGWGVRSVDDSVIHRLWEENISLMFLEDGAFIQFIRRGEVYRQEPDGPTYRLANPIHIAQATGGDALIAPDPQHPEDLLTRMRQRYTLWFDQPADAEPGKVHSIQVELSPEARRRFPKAVVQAREGYVTR